MDEREIIYEENNDKQLYDSVHNYTKYKLIEMLISRMNDNRLNLNNLNAIEDLTDDVLKTLSIAGLKFYSELKNNFDKGE